MADQFITRDMKRSNRNLLTTGVIFALAGALLFFVASQNVGTDRAPALVWGIILSCCALVPLTALAFRLKTAWHPTWRAAARYGDPYLLGLELGLEFGVGLLGLAPLSLVFEADLEAAIQKCHDLQAFEDGLGAELGLLEDARVGPEGDERARPAPG